LQLLEFTSVYQEYAEKTRFVNGIWIKQTEIWKWIKDKSYGTRTPERIKANSLPTAVQGLKFNLSTKKRVILFAIYQSLMR
jgi:hypothetical protein